MTRLDNKIYNWMYNVNNDQSLKFKIDRNIKKTELVAIISRFCEIYKDKIKSYAFPNDYTFLYLKIANPYREQVVNILKEINYLKFDNVGLKINSTIHDNINNWDYLPVNMSFVS